MNDTEFDEQVGTVIRQALTEMKCMVLRAQHLSEDIDALRANPTEEGVAAFCRKHGRLHEPSDGRATGPAAGQNA